jgi:hypothetical protein
VWTLLFDWCPRSSVLLSAAVTANGVTLAAQIIGGQFDFTSLSGLRSPQGLATAFYTGSGNFDVVLDLTASGADIRYLERQRDGPRSHIGV